MSQEEDYKIPERRKDYPILFEELIAVKKLLLQENNKWSFLGFTAKDLKKFAIYFVFGIWWLAAAYHKLDAYETNTDHLMVCNDNRDKWATAKYGHPFECGKPTDGFTPNFGRNNLGQ